jgi:hypothetical protein
MSAPLKMRVVAAGHSAEHTFAGPAGELTAGAESGK